MQAELLVAELLWLARQVFARKPQVKAFAVSLGCLKAEPGTPLWAGSWGRRDSPKLDEGRISSRIWNTNVQRRVGGCGEVARDEQKSEWKRDQQFQVGVHGPRPLVSAFCSSGGSFRNHNWIHCSIYLRCLVSELLCALCRARLANCALFKHDGTPARAHH